MSDKVGSGAVDISMVDKKGSGLGIYNMSIIAFVIVVFLLLSIFTRGFMSVANLTNVLRQVAFLGLLVLGLTPILLIGEIDLSLVALMTNSAIIGTIFIVRTGSVVGGIIVILLIGILVGIFNGFFIGRLGVISFIVTLAVMVIGEGVAAFFTKNVSIKGLPESYCWLGRKTFGFIPVQFIIFLGFVIIIYLLLHRSYIGRRIYAIGNNKQASILCGIPVKKIIFSLFVFSGLMASIAGMVISAQIGIASPSMGRQRLLIDYITATVVGGVSIGGGKGNVFNAIAGTFFIVIFNNVINLLGIGYFRSLALKGLLLVTIVAIDNIRKR